MLLGWISRAKVVILIPMIYLTGEPGKTIFPETGEIIFPFLEPFGSSIPEGLEDYRYQLIYDTTKTFAKQDKINDKWLMAGKQTGDVTSTYQLGFNVVENSVRVVLLMEEN